MRTISLLAGALPMVAGCYLIHGLDAPERDADAGVAPVRDASIVQPLPAMSDAGSRFVADAAPLPNDEPDVAPDGRPSDDPDAADWGSPPDPSSEPCCDVGPVVGLDDPVRQASPPAVAWDGDEWGVAWSDRSAPTFGGDPVRTLFRRIDASASPATDAVVVESSGTTLGGMAYGNHRFLIAGNGAAGFRDYRRAWWYVLDVDGGVHAGAPLPSTYGAVRVARHPLVHGWATVASRTHVEGDGTADGLLLVEDDSLAELARRDLGIVPSGDATAGVASLKRELVVVAAALDTTRLHTYEGPEIEEVDSTDLGRFGTELVAAPFRDLVVLAGREYASGPLEVALWNPFDRELVVSPHEVARTTSGQGLGVAADDVGGTIALCYPSGGSSGRDANTVRFALLDPDGAPLGTPVELAPDFRYVASCAVAASGPDNYVLVFWNAAWSEPRHSILAASVRVRR